MRKTKISQKISIINYFISALGNLKKGTNTNKLLLKIWLLSSTLTFIVSTIALAFIGTLSADSLWIKFIIYVALFGISSILPSVIFSIVYYSSLVIEKINIFLNFLYLVIIGEISIVRLVNIVISKIKREFRLSNKELIKYIGTNLKFQDKIISYIKVFTKLGQDDLRHTSNIFNVIFLGSSTIFVAITSFVLSNYENDTTMLIGGTLLSYIAFTITAMALVGITYAILSLVKYFKRIIQFIVQIFKDLFKYILIVIGFIIKLPILIIKGIHKLYMMIVERIELFFKEMKEEYEGSKIEIHNYIEAKVKEQH